MTPAIEPRQYVAAFARVADQDHGGKGFRPRRRLLRRSCPAPRQGTLAVEC
jgi:hypothetical protein